LSSSRRSVVANGEPRVRVFHGAEKDDHVCSKNYFCHSLIILDF
jgi:hypothetical protein